MPITALYASVLTLFAARLATSAAWGRTLKLEEEELRLRVRVHGNLVENAPLFILCLGLCESAAGAPALLHLLGVSFLVARWLHARGLGRSGGASVPRFLGASGTFTLLFTTAVYCLWLNLPLLFAG